MVHDKRPYSQDEKGSAQSSYMNYSVVRHDMTAAHGPPAMTDYQEQRDL
jgi:hypothetical protein